MKIKIYFLLIFFMANNSFCQINTKVYGDVPPFKIIGEKVLDLSGDYFAKDMKGGALVYLIINKDCKLLNFAIIRISVSDEKKENLLEYSDSEIHKHMSDKKYYILEKNYYPIYIHPLYELIKELLNEQEIVYSEDTFSLKEINTVGLKLKIR